MSFYTHTELMLDMVKRYKESTKIPQQQDLF